MDIKTKVTLQYLMKKSKTIVDLKWKINKFITNGDVSFLGHDVKTLNQLIDVAKSKEMCDKSDIIIGINRVEPCETAKKLKIKKLKRDGE